MTLGVHLREALAAAREAMGRLPDRGVAFWLVAILLVLLLPAPVALAVIVARRRRGDQRSSSSSTTSLPTFPVAPVTRIGELAGRLGYRSEAAFSRAFKRLGGAPPAPSGATAHRLDRRFAGAQPRRATVEGDLTRTTPSASPIVVSGEG